MPDDYQAILSDLGVDTTTNSESTASDAQGTETDTNVVESESTTASQSQDDSIDSNTNTSENNSVVVEDQKRNEAFAAMRAENTKYKKFMQQMMKGAGYEGDEEGFINQLTEASYQRQAQRQGNQVSPELLKRMDELENQNRTLIDAQNRNMFAANLQSMQDNLKLSEKDIKEFIDLAVKENIDLTIPGTNFVTLYQGLFFDKLKDRMLEDERQKWIAQNNKANNASNPDGKSGKKDPAPTDVNTMAEFDSLLQSIPKK